MTYQSTNPFDGKIQKSYEHFSASQLEKSLATAESCFQSWKLTSYQERAAIVNKAAKLLHAQGSGDIYSYICSHIGWLCSDSSVGKAMESSAGQGARPPYGRA